MHPYKLRISYRTIHTLPCHRHAHTQRYRPHCHTFDSIPLHCNTFHCIARHCNHYSDLHCILHWIWNCFGKFFLLFCFFFLGFLFCPFSLLFTGFWRWKGIWRIFEFEPSIFHGICNILVLLQHLELDAAISTVFTTCLSSNLFISMKLQHCGARIVHVMVVCN